MNYTLYQVIDYRLKSLVHVRSIVFEYHVQHV